MFFEFYHARVKRTFKVYILLLICFVFPIRESKLLWKSYESLPIIKTHPFCKRLVYYTLKVIAVSISVVKRFKIKLSKHRTCDLFETREKIKCFPRKIIKK